MAEHPTSSPPYEVGEGDALLLIDLINDLKFAGGEKVLPWAMKLRTPVRRAAARFRRARLPVIYVNDNFGRWRETFEQIYRHATRRGARGQLLCRSVKPQRSDYFMLKPRHSAFFCTSLVPLLEDLKAWRLILAGIATNLCVLFTAHDAHMHQFPMIVLSDCCAAESDFDHNIALSQLERFCGAAICRSDELIFTARGGRSRPD